MGKLKENLSFCQVFQIRCYTKTRNEGWICYGKLCLSAGHLFQRFLKPTFRLLPDRRKRIDPPYISFNKLVCVKNIGEYREQFGEYIYYGYGFTHKIRSDGLMVLKFATKRVVPIAAIRAAIQLDHSLEWYAVEENCIYVSRFIGIMVFKKRFIY